MSPRFECWQPAYLSCSAAQCSIMLTQPEPREMRHGRSATRLKTYAFQNRYGRMQQYDAPVGNHCRGTSPLRLRGGRTNEKAHGGLPGPAHAHAHAHAHAWCSLLVPNRPSLIPPSIIFPAPLILRPCQPVQLNLASNFPRFQVQFHLSLSAT